jgi:hypothetical protein
MKKSHLQPAYPPMPSICKIPYAKRPRVKTVVISYDDYAELQRYNMPTIDIPPKAPAKARETMIMPALVAISSRLQNMAT